MLSFLIEKEFKQLARNKIIPRMLVALPLMASRPAGYSSSTT